MKDNIRCKVIIIAALFLLTAFSVSAQTVKDRISIGIVDEVNSSILSEKRKLNIYLPEGYGENDTTRYPVIYLLDGGMDEDFIHVVGLVQFNTFPWVNQIPRSIVVGVVNTDRRRDFTYATTVKAEKEKYPATGGSGKFIAFLEKELQPYIAKQYKTNGSATIIGQSLAGLLAAEILLEKPGLFDTYIIVSPSLWWDNGSLLKQSMAITTTQPATETRIYIGVGKEGLTPGVEPRVMEVDANLLAEKVRAVQSKHIDLYFDYLPEENHATIMHQAVSNAFRQLYPKQRD